MPTDVETVLQQLFEAAGEALEAEDIDTCRQTIDSAESVVSTKLPDGERKARLRHGCERVRQLAEEGDHTVAAEYLEAMARQLN